MVILRLARKAVQKDKLAAASKGDRLALLNKFATEYAEVHDATLRFRAEKIVALENDEPVVPKPEPVHAKKRKAA